MEETAKTQTKRMRYLYLDVVDFTRDRSVEAQTEIVGALNEIVRGTVYDLGIKTDDILYFPTGDGLGIAILDESAPFDIHAKLALALLAKIHQRNQAMQDSMRKFDIRVGINENVDNLITDINGRPNVAGAGINMAQRVMSCADARQLLVGQMVFETLTYREHYMHAFRSYQAPIKHGLVIPVHQFIEEGHEGVSSDVPIAFAPSVQKERRFTELEAYYLGFTIKHREFIRLHSGIGGSAHALIVLLRFLAEDAVEAMHATDFSPATIKTYGGADCTLEDAFNYYMSIDFWVYCELADYIRKELSALAPYLEDDFPKYFPATQEGKEKLRRDRPDIFRSLGLEVTSNHSS
ncbi:MAG: adenylate/guanylate cyclase domain-containing protein [bacterium]